MGQETLSRMALQTSMPSIWGLGAVQAIVRDVGSPLQETLEHGRHLYLVIDN